MNLKSELSQPDEISTNTKQAKGGHRLEGTNHSSLLIEDVCVGTRIQALGPVE